MTNREAVSAGCGACEVCGEIDPCVACDGTGLVSHNYNGLLKEVNQMLINIMIDHPYFQAKKVGELNHKVCEKIREEQGIHGSGE